MSNRRLMGAVASALLVAPVVAQGADAPAAMPDEEFLEYLGSWDGDDSDWVVLQGVPSKPASQRAAEPAPKAAEGSDHAGGKMPQEQKK